MYDFPYIVAIYTSKLSESVCTNLIADLKQFDVDEVEKVNNETEFKELIEKASKQILCVCSASACFYSFGNAYMKEVPSNLKSLLLFCGPYEGFYSRWSTSCPAVKFLSHNLKEVRRAIIWYLAGGDFSLNGNTIPPPSFESPLMMYKIPKPTIQRETSAKVESSKPINQMEKFTDYQLEKLVIVWHLAACVSNNNLTALSL